MPSSRPTRRPPASHFDYEATEAKCQCDLCTGYRWAKAVYRQRRSLDRYAAYLAAEHQREVYSEMSFMLTFGPRPHQLAGECLGWLYDRIIDPGYQKQIWWALDGDRRSLQSWIEDFQADWGARHSLGSEFWAVSGIC